MRLAAGLTVAALAAFASACTATVTPEPAPVIIEQTQGTLTVDWTINGTKDPAQCSQGAAAAIEITVTDFNDNPLGTYQQSCDAFATSITLDAGSYFAHAHLIDAVGAARTTTVDINSFTIRGNDDLTTPIDFSASSFF